MASTRTPAAPMPIRIILQDPASRQSRREKHQKLAEARSHAARYIGRRARWDREASYRRKKNTKPSGQSEPADDGEDHGKVSISIRNALTQNKRDPFSQYDASEHPVFFQDLVEYCYDRLWPDFIEVSGNPAVHPGPREWRLAAQENPAVYHVHLASVADHGTAMYHARDFADECQKMRLFHHTKALRLVRQMIQTMGPDTVPTDSLVMAVHNLSFQGTGWDYRVIPESHPPSPVFKARIIGHYGRKVPADDHVRGINTLVRAKGGLEEIKLAGIAELIWLWSLDNCAAVVRTPDFPILRHYEALLTDYTKEIKISVREDRFEGLGSGFLTLPAKGDIGRLRDCLLCTAAVSVDLSKLEPGYENKPHFRLLLKVVRAVHHQLLSVPVDIEDFDNDEDENIKLIFSITRLAALLYHDIVIFPQIDTSEVKPRLADQLRQILTQKSPSFSPGAGQGKYRGLVLWALMVGSIGATWTKHRQWFVQQLYDRSRQLELETFSQFKAFMSKYLWFENIDVPALKAWLEGEFASGTTQPDKDEDTT